MYLRLSFAATVSGVILQLAGLALHARGVALAAREGLFALSSPGNLLGGWLKGRSWVLRTGPGRVETSESPLPYGKDDR